MKLDDPRTFDPASVSGETRSLNQSITAQMRDQPTWWETGAPVMRERRRKGLGVFPPPTMSAHARTIEIRGPAGAIALRIIAPREPRGIYLHIHGGGWVLGAADLQDPLLESLADAAGVTCVSIEYRLAPEHRYPAAVDDCETALLWVIQNARREFGVDALSIGGESAGAHLAVLSLLRLRDRHGFTGLCAANLVYGAYDLALTPSARAFGLEPLVLRTPDIERFVDAFLPTGKKPHSADVSPLYANLRSLCPALFTVGNRDALLDDTLFMYPRWLAAGNAAELDIYPGGCHGFTLLPGPLATESLARQARFLSGAIRSASEQIRAGR